MVERAPYSDELCRRLIASSPEWWGIGFEPHYPDSIEPQMEHMQLLQRMMRVDDDGAFGPQTSGAFDAYLKAYPELLGTPNYDDTMPFTEPQPDWSQRLASAIATFTSGRVGYATPTEKDAKNLAEPLIKRYECEYMSAKDAAKARANGYRTTHTAGGCGSLAERVLALTLGDTTPHYCANQTAPWIPPAQRAERFHSINDNTPGAMLNGVQAIKADGWTPICEGYAFAMDYMRLAHQDIPAAMIRLKAPLAIIHQPSGHVTTAVLSDPFRKVVDHCVWYTQMGDILPAAVLRVAADGSGARVGQPTTVCFWHAYPAFAGRAHVFFVMRPDSLPDADRTLRMRLEAI